jgi:hypothetical protein
MNSWAGASPFKAHLIVTPLTNSDAYSIPSDYLKWFDAIV